MDEDILVLLWNLSRLKLGLEWMKKRGNVVKKRSDETCLETEEDIGRKEEMIIFNLNFTKIKYSSSVSGKEE